MKLVASSAFASVVAPPAGSSGVASASVVALPLVPGWGGPSGTDTDPALLGELPQPTNQTPPTQINRHNEGRTPKSMRDLLR
jgi:hypothetical protein